MNEKLPTPCEPCKATGLFQGSECEQCRGKGYRLIINGVQASTQVVKPQRWQGRQPNRT